MPDSTTPLPRPRARSRTARTAAAPRTAKHDVPHAEQAAAHTVGALIRTARKARALALRDVAERTGLSISFLSQVERNVLAPSVSALKRIAEVLGLPVGRLMLDVGERPSATSAVAVLRRADRKRIGFPKSSIRYELLTPDMRRRASLLWVTAEPGAESGPPFSHEGEDGVVVLKGQLDVEVGGVWHALGPGDSIYFSSEVPHRWRNGGRTETEAIWMSTPPSF